MEDVRNSKCKEVIYQGYLRESVEYALTVVRSVQGPRFQKVPTDDALEPRVGNAAGSYIGDALDISAVE